MATEDKCIPETMIKAADRIAKTIIENWTSEEKALLMNMLEVSGIPGNKLLNIKEMSESICVPRYIPCYNVSDFLKYLKNEREVHHIMAYMKNAGLVDIVENKDLKTTMYGIMPLGILISSRLTLHERENGYPVMKYILDRTIDGAKKDEEFEAVEKLVALREMYD
ncbi:MAG: hypothetical protein KAS90_06745 [Candidatus Aenigmarchaeota archaeon]|nr:hypothetical protein [Candidatus Aenigmarchaeota archaeon]